MEVRLFTPGEFQLYTRVLGFLEEVGARRGRFQPAGAAQEGTTGVLFLTFTKVVNDCRAILLLAQSGFYVQAGILSRSTMDACYLLICAGYEGDDSALVKRWLEGRRVTHWTVVERLNEGLEREHQLDIRDYRRMRRRLDDFVHARYETLRLYPAQSPGPTPMDDNSFRELTFWRGLVYFYLITCLLAVQFIEPDLEEQAGRHLGQLQTYGGF